MTFKLCPALRNAAMHLAIVAGLENPKNYNSSTLCCYWAFVHPLQPDVYAERDITLLNS